MTTQLASIVEQVRPVLERYGVKKAGSDLDLVVEMPPGSSLLELVGLQQDIADLLGIEVDAGTYRALHPQLRDRILAEEVRILGS
jgi:hypothetical protein